MNRLVPNSMYDDCLSLVHCNLDRRRKTRGRIPGGAAQLRADDRRIRQGVPVHRRRRFGCCPQGVEYELVEHQLTPEQVRIYNAYAGAFVIIHNNLDAAMRVANITGAISWNAPTGRTMRSSTIATSVSRSPPTTSVRPNVCPTPRSWATDRSVRRLTTSARWQICPLSKAQCMRT